MSLSQLGVIFNTKNPRSSKSLGWDLRRPKQTMPMTFNDLLFAYGDNITYLVYFNIEQLVQAYNVNIHQYWGNQSLKHQQESISFIIHILSVLFSLLNLTCYLQQPYEKCRSQITNIHYRKKRNRNYPYNLIKQKKE